MPSVSKKQHNFMAAVANNPSFASKAGVPQSVGADFEAADKGLKFGKGSTSTRADLQKVNNPKTLHGKESIMKKGGTTMANTSRMNRLEELGRVNAEKADTGKGKRNLMAEKKRIVSEIGSGMKKGGMKKMAFGGSAGKTGGGDGPPGGGGVHMMAKGGFTKEANGIAQRGLTKGKQIKMSKGGKAC